LSDLIADMASERGGAQVQPLAEYAVRYVLVTAPVDRSLARSLDALPGLVRESTTPAGAALWRLDQPVSRLRLSGKAGAVTPLPSGTVSASVRVSQGATGQLTFSEAVDGGWRATLDGRPLAGNRNGWEQAFDLPGGGGRLEVTYDPAPRARWLTVEVLALLVVLVLALPGGRPRRADDEDEPQPPRLGRHASVESPPATQPSLAAAGRPA
jgi:hypothetical protein